jgi:ribosomal protein S18 acetylase RimI-like enzyme
MILTVERTRELVWAAHPELLAIGASGRAHNRAVTRVGPVVAVDLGVDHHWGLQVTAGLHLPAREDAEAAMQWCRARDLGHGWCVSLPEGLVGSEPWSHLEPVERLTMWAMDVDAAARLPLTPPEGLELDDNPSLADVHASYGGWMDDTTLAHQLVGPDDMNRTDRRFIVARRDGAPVGCAFVWWAAGTAYLSGIGVVEQLRGQGIGHALSTAAARLSVSDVRGTDAQVVWMHATDEGAALYSRMGFTTVDTEIQLVPR